MKTNPERLGYSAEVRMELRLNGYVLPIGQLGPDFIILDNPIAHPPADAEIAVWIDGKERHWNVCLPEGIDAASPQTKTA